MDMETFKKKWLAATERELAIEEMEDYFTYLDELRESGATNMYAAGSYIADEFAITAKEASVVLAAWMTSFDPKIDPADRAREYMKNA
jgi:hypothetical protein